jgi:hypothetical protein
MATFSVTPQIGIDLVNTLPATLYATGGVQQGYTAPYLLGQEVWGSDGKRYVFAKANASITASTAVCTVNASTFLATATGGSYTSPATNMVTGDFGWFAAASV